MSRAERKFVRWGAVSLVALSSFVALGAGENDEPAERNAEKKKVDFVRDVRPILATHCVRCHGVKKQESGLRLDFRKFAFEAADSGDKVIVVGQPDESSLVHRIRSDDADEVMPPEGKPLSEKQIATLIRWIGEGADWPIDVDEKSTASTHWAYQPPLRHAPPAVNDVEWVQNPVDRFVLARLEEEGLQPSPTADRYTLIRRVSLDLTGLPPTPDEADAFVHDPRSDAYLRLVDRLLSSTAYGERWANMWLDLARYADSQGYEKDNPRTIWRYRDWVISAFNENKPFDRFTIEQIAGDLLPDAGVNEQLATAFHRNTMTNTEGGTDDEEFRVAAIVDRVNTTMQVWMGTTMGCAQCHSHKYDPITQREYYRFFAFFDNTEDADRNDETPTLLAPSDDQRRAMQPLQTEIARIESQLTAIPAETKKEILEILKVSADKRDEKQKQKISGLHEQIGSEPAALFDRLSKQQSQLAAIGVPPIPVMRELPSEKLRTTRIHIRGDFLNQGDVVDAGVPATFHPLRDESPANRLGLARWLVDAENPLTPRVMINRLWEQFFGVGLVRTSEDFGTQGSPPTHPKLFDWLAREFVRREFDLKAMQRLLVTSATYRQTSRLTEELLKRDPYNQLLSRGPRFRLDAEMIRDQALAISGLLSRKMLGPSVMPPQPEGVWQVVYSGREWKTSEGEDRHRRGLYTYWRRTSPYPSMTIFDVPSREFCVVKRIRTNTPLQALVTLNDPVYIEAAQALAARVVTEGGATLEARMKYAFRLCLMRPPTEIEVERLLNVYHQQLDHYRQDAEAAAAMAGTATTIAAEVEPAELAAWTVLGNILLNLDETLTRG